MKSMIFVPKVAYLRLEFTILSYKLHIQYYHLVFIVLALLLSSAQFGEINIIKFCDIRIKILFVLFWDYLNPHLESGREREYFYSSKINIRRNIC